MANPFLVSNDVIVLYQQGIDALITTLGKNCRLIYSPKVTPCTNCIYDPIGKKSSNRYKTGGPVPFPNGSICPVCGGVGNISEPAEEIIVMVVQWNPKNFPGNRANVDSPNAICRTYTYGHYFPKLQKCIAIDVDLDVSGYASYRCNRIREPIMFGIQDSKYVEAFWQRAG